MEYKKGGTMANGKIGFKLLIILVSIFSIVIIIQLNGISGELKQINSQLKGGESHLDDKE